MDGGWGWGSGSLVGEDPLSQRHQSEGQEYLALPGPETWRCGGTELLRQPSVLIGSALIGWELAAEKDGFLALVAGGRRMGVNRAMCLPPSVPGPPSTKIHCPG